ncbi:hypothetical protein ACFW2V_13495 [Streptomyces sp. NPDC058947]|uniref:hypothetical protein n=1 Tax=Streptomyces sp. NPDC058947 TaxID=3346675 RepID=UPI0036AD0CB2
MIKKLKRALGMEVADGRPGADVIGRVSTSHSGNSILEIGRFNEDGSWTKVQDGGHIALTPEEREKLIEVLESHRRYKVIELGDTVTVVGDEFEVLAVQYLNATADGGRLRGTVLAYCDRKREYAVFTANPYGEVNYGTYTHSSQDALNAYATRIVEHLYPHFNASPPNLTFAHVAERDKLTSDA